MQRLWRSDFLSQNRLSRLHGNKPGLEGVRRKREDFSFTVAYDFAPPEFASSTPYALAVVNLDEGFSMLTNIVDCDLDKLQCDMPVEVLFDPVTPEITLPKFRPVTA